MEKTLEKTWWENLAPDWFIDKSKPSEVSVEKPLLGHEESFKAQILKDIPYYHKLYAKHSDPIYLEIIKNLDRYLSELSTKGG